MNKSVKVVSESFKEWENDNKLNEEGQQLNESAKGLLQKFVDKPEKKDRLTAAFARQCGKVKGLKDALLKLSDENQITIAKQALKALEDPKMGYPWIKIVDRKIAGAGALGVESPGVTGK